jgi:serine/threonine protein phosphatase PrpC
LGDLALKNEGVINEPDVCEFEINENTSQLIIASDGLWDVCEDEEAVELTKGMNSSLQ